MATTNKKINFSYFERKQDFTAALQAELTNSIVFVEDTKEVFTHGEFFGIRGVTLNYDSSTTKLQLKDGNVVVSEMDASAFVKDDMLDNVTLVKVQETGVTEAVPYLKFVFNTGSGKAAVRVSVSDLVDTYDGANIELTSSFAEAQSYSAPAIGDSVDEAVGKLLKGHSDNVTALSGKQATIVGAATTVTLNDLTGDRALISSGTGKIAVSDVTATELGYLDGVTGNVQTQINNVSETAAKGLKCVDLATYQGTNGEIVLHAGADTDEFEHGAVYERQSETIIIPASTPYIDINTDELAGMGLRRGTYYKTVGEGVPLRWFTYQFSDGTETKVNVPIVAEETVGGYIYQRVGIGESVYHDGQFVKVVSATYRESGGGLPLTVVLSDDTTLTDTSSGRGNITPWAANYIDAYIAENGDTFYCPNSYTSQVFVSEPWEDGIVQVIELFATDARPNSKYYKGYAQEQTEIQVGKWERIYLDPTIADTITGAASTITTADLTASKALISDANGKVAASSVTATELGYLSGVTSNIQTQFGTKRVYFGTSDTAASTAIKVITTDADFPTVTVNNEVVPMTGVMICVRPSISDSGRSEQMKFRVNNCKALPYWYDRGEWTGLSASRAFVAKRPSTFVFDGAYWVFVSLGIDTNYAAGSGLKLSSNQFSLNVPRVTKSANSLPGKNTAIIEEYSASSEFNLPTNAWYHIITMQGSDADTAYATQLALGMTTTAAYYRNYGNGTWTPWLRLNNPSVDSTPTASSTNPVQSGGTKTYVDEQVATKSSITIRQWVTE